MPLHLHPDCLSKMVVVGRATTWYHQGIPFLDESPPGSVGSKSVYMEAPKSPQPASSIPVPKTSRGGIKGYINDVVRELKKVDWPPVKETNRLTGVVLAVCAIIAITMTVLSFGVDTIIKLIQGKL